MQEFNTSLLREKFIINDPNDKDGSAEPVIALSNRIVLNFHDDQGKLVESLVVRAQNMHTCIRMAVRTLRSFFISGPLSRRVVPMDWEVGWEEILSNFDRLHNPDIWCAVYKRGQILFQDGEYHTFLDTIEKSVAICSGPYEEALKMAEREYRKGNEKPHIEYDGNVALNVNYKEDQARFGIILRGVHKTTFSFSATKKDDKNINFPQCFKGCAAYLEGIQLAFMIGMGEEKLRSGKILRGSDEEKKHKAAQIRLNEIKSEINKLHESCRINYRPEQPNFDRITAEAAEFSRQMIL